ncbi:hypothetical protein [Nonomuraea wenchangensis]|uniref:Uncharacterized protein n=1 Tax=Nonomuraea wenchangensis TaxID=568860 RepID=A0A1I0F531_9ACTN|nr:hypothetical protein [Nonomuraea wenchangensis]SET52522.1 hypothetical protein SAMN05421811_103310 [Nonomuraea wenchangensis]
MSIISPPSEITSQTANERAEIIAGLRALIDMFEQVPEIPVQSILGWAVGGRDKTAVPTMEAAAKAVQQAGIAHEYSVHEHGRTLWIEVGGISFSVSHVHDAAYAAHRARRSYDQVVQVGA